MSGVFSGNQWTTASGSTWRVVIEPDFVNQVAELCNHLSLASKDTRATCEKIVEQAQAVGDGSSDAGKQKEVVKSLVSLVEEKGINPGAEPRDIEGFANLAAALVEQYYGSSSAESSSQEAEQLLVSLSSALSKTQSTESPAVLSARYSALSSLFNSLPESAASTTRSNILLNLFQLAASKDDLAVLSNATSALPTWLSAEWSISESSEADKTMSRFVAALEGASDKQEAGEAIRRMLQAYAGENTAEELREKLVLYTLASGTAFDVEGLPKTSGNSSIAQLREIFQNGTLADLSSFSGDLPAPLEKEKLQEKLQYILLADFASKKIGAEISYDEIAAALGLDSSADPEDRALEVESWIIATIRVGLMTARLHQPTNTASIIRASPRSFGNEQWKTLQTRLESWKSSVGNILDVVGKAVGPAPSQQYQQQQQRQSAQHHDAQSIVHAAADHQQQQGETVEVA